MIELRKKTADRVSAYAPGPGVRVHPDLLTLPELDTIPAPKPIRPSNIRLVGIGITGLILVVLIIIGLFAVLSGNWGVIFLLTWPVVFLSTIAGKGLIRLADMSTYRKNRDALRARARVV